jgi:hypothetical protein
MPEKESTSNTSTPTSNIDLNSLADLSFGPSWADEKNAKKNKKKEFATSSKHGNNQRSRIINKDRRGQTKFRNSHSGTSFNKRKEHFENRKTDFIPRFDVKIYPQDETFETLIKQLKGNFKTYQLFEITRLILEKSDRFVCLINRIKKSADGTVEPIYFTPEDGLPFDTEEEAINHFCEHFLENFFKIETVEVEPPKGNFSVVYRCPFTKAMIGPPNFHRFPELLKAHHSAKIKNLSLEDYQSKLESLSEENFINEWLESTKQQKHYHIKTEDNADEPGTKFITIEEARRFLITNHKDKIVKTSSNFRFSAGKLDSLPNSNLKTTILQSIDAQRRFPLDTANNIRGRLRRHKFTIYKKGSKGISYVCCVKRKFRDDTTVFTDSINNLITFIEKNQQIGIQKLPYKFLSIPYPVVENAETAEKESTSENSDSISEEDTNKITEVIRNVRWLISEGYVTEYSDGKLWIHPKAEVNHSTSSTSPKNEKKNESGEVSVASKTEDSKTPEAFVEDEKEIVAVSEEKSTQECKNEASTSESCEIPHSSEEVNETEVESTDI